MKILLTFIGDNDCKLSEGKAGAIISILHQREFDKVYLFYNHERYLKHTSEIREYCRKHFPGLDVKYQEAASPNPTDYNILYPAMYQAVTEILADPENKDAEYTISLTSGTGTMHACWFFLQQSGVIHARLIQTSKEIGITEVDFNFDNFPQTQDIDARDAKLTRLNREKENLTKQIDQLKNPSKPQYEGIMGNSPAIIQIKEQIEKLAKFDIPVFIFGESGTGKELVAKAIHNSSYRKDKKLVTINCGAISTYLFESEFFGHAKEAFTGANTDKPGKFKEADGGTIFLDEVCDLPLEMQVKLLRVLNDGTFFPVGSTKQEKVDVRIISATNKDIHKLVSEGKFREDLYYRLVKDFITLPPLRDRGDDKRLIAENILFRLNEKYGQNKKLTPSAIDFILQYPWKGNIRQLENVLERAFIYSQYEISHKDIKIIELETISGISIPDDGIDFDNEIVPKYYEATLRKTKGNAAEAARLLGIKEHTFRARLRTLGLL